MKIAILEAGTPPERLAGRYPGYGRMTADRLGPGHAVSVFRVNRDDWPADPNAFDATLVTGPPAGAYDLLPWIGTLIGVLRALDPGKPLVGICFGHRVMAAAFGSRVEKSPKGWGIGLHTYAIHETADWMDGPPQVSVPAIHQDQVVAAPPASRTLAGSAFTPNGILAYSERHALSFQCHQEFTTDYARTLIAGHRPNDLDATVRARALASLDAPANGARVDGWIQRFLEESAEPCWAPPPRVQGRDRLPDERNSTR